MLAGGPVRLGLLCLGRSGPGVLWEIGEPVQEQQRGPLTARVISQEPGESPGQHVFHMGQISWWHDRGLQREAFGDPFASAAGSLALKSGITEVPSRRFSLGERTAQGGAVSVHICGAFYPKGVNHPAVPARLIAGFWPRNPWFDRLSQHRGELWRQP